MAISEVLVTAYQLSVVVVICVALGASLWAWCWDMSIKRASHLKLNFGRYLVVVVVRRQDCCAVWSDAVPRWWIVTGAKGMHLSLII